MKITSDNPHILDELYSEMRKEHLKSEKEIKQIEGAQGDIVTALAIGTFALQSISTFIGILTYIDDKYKSDVNHYIHLKYKDGLVVKLENLSMHERQDKLEHLRNKFNTLEYIEIG